MSFESLGLLPELVRALSDKGYTEATAIQGQAIPLIMNGEDVLGGAQTGTGKTAAFTLPVLQRLRDNEVCRKHVFCIGCCLGRCFCLQQPPQLLQNAR